MDLKGFRFALATLFFGAVLGAFADGARAVTNTFETTVGDVVSTINNWSGFGNVVEESYDAPAVGLPASGEQHTKTLAVSGLVTRVCSDVAAPSVVDMMVKLQNEDEELIVPTGNVQMAVSLDTNGFLNVYHKAESGSAAAQWTKVGGCLTNGTDASVWKRLTVKFDYTAKMFELRLDGSLCTNAVGWRKTSDGVVAGGGWYYMAYNAESLASVNVSGLGSVDDVIVANGDVKTIPDDATITGTDNVAVPYNWFEEQGLAAEPNVQAPGGSGYTLAQAYAAGTDPRDEHKLYVSDASFADNNVTLAFNGVNKTYKVQTSSSPDSGWTEGSAATTTSAGSTWTGTIPDQKVTYFKFTTTEGSVDTVNIFGLLRVNSTLTNTIVALPWKALAAANAGDVKVADFVRTTNLTPGDKLLVFDGSTYTGWTLSNGEWGAMSTFSVGGSEVATAANGTTLPRGKGIWLIRQNPSVPFYVYGQYDSSAAQTAITKGAMQLIAPPSTSDYNLNEGNFPAPAIGDRILVPTDTLPVTYFRTNDSKWGREERSYGEPVPGTGYRKLTVTTNETATIPAGTGFWYTNSVSSGTSTIDW